MVHSAGLRFLLTDDTQAVALAALVDHALTIPELYQHSQVDINPLTPSDRLFHVLYTSGSTDDPKGVCGTHQQMQARLEWLWQAFPLSDTDICCQKNRAALRRCEPGDIRNFIAGPSTAHRA
jgi:non-ribosomal peptide synthetase component F